MYGRHHPIINPKVPKGPLYKGEQSFEQLRTYIYSILQANVCLMKPWIVLTGISLILDIFNILKAVISLAFADALSSIFGWVLGAYLFLVVWSYKKEVEEGVGGGDYQGEVHYKREEREMLKA